MKVSVFNYADASSRPHGGSEVRGPAEVWSAGQGPTLFVPRAGSGMFYMHQKLEV